MLEVKHMSAQKKEAAVGTDEMCVSSSEPGCVYETQDWMFSPSCSPEHSSISPLLAEETFRYMTLFALGASSSSSSSKVLSSDRVEQMTRTYNDIDVVTHLLAERDRDLELAARIGQSLLQRNHVLQERNDALEEQLTQALDQVHQLQHELVKKDELLRVVSSVSEESETDSGSSTPQCLPPPGGALAHMVTLGQLEALQNKLQELEEENLKLRSEASQLKKETCTYEEKEQQLVSDCVKELRESNSQMVSLSEELSQKNEDLIKQQEEIAHLLAQIVQLQQRLKELALEKEELRIHLQASKDSQRQLTAELNELADRNAECVGMLHESQEEVKELRSKSTPSAGLHRYHGLYPLDSLAAEIEGSMRREMSVEEEMAFQDQRSNQSLVFRTVRSANEAMMRAAPPIPGSGDGGVVMTSQPFRSHTEDPEHASGGCAGRSRGGDVVSALRRLTLRRQNVLSERQYFQAERNKKLQELAEGAGSEGCGSGCSSPMGSVRSSFTNLSELSGSSTCFRTFLPEKLQIVKPMEGSLTLHHWQQLAKPHLASVLDLHPGVITKGFRPLPQDALYHLSDLEEDEDNARAPWAEKTTGGDEDGGITFCVQSASTPDRCVSPPPKATPLSASVRGSPVSLAADVKSTVGTAALPVSQPGPGTTAPSIVPGMNPGKCQSSTFSTYTFTTCRILHPSDVTQVTPSYGSSPSACGYTPSSLRSTPSTPVTPCRLSVGESSPPRRPTAPPGGLAKLVLEKGISAQRVPPPAETAPPLHLPPRTPPNSPCPSPDPFEPSSAHPDNFLASRPAELFLQDVYGLKPDLVERLRRLGLDKNVIRGAESSAPHQHSTLLSAGGGSLLVGLRRNQSVPAMISKAPPSHPTSLPLPAPSWGNLKPRPNRRHTSLSETPPSGKD